MKIKLILSITIALFLPVFNVLAQMLENIPGQESVESGDLVGYLNNIYKFGISITGILAIFMISLGAFAYMVTSVGNSSKILDAKATIQNALLGLIIVLTAYLMLYVINPDLVAGTLSVPSVEIDEIVDNEVGCCVSVVTTGQSAVFTCSAPITRGECDAPFAVFSSGEGLKCVEKTVGTVVKKSCQ